MLILTRRVGETIYIGADVTVTVLGVKGNQVRLGTNAPKDVPVHRQEIFEKIREQEQEQCSASEAPARTPIDNSTVVAVASNEAVMQ